MQEIKNVMFLHIIHVIDTLFSLIWLLFLSFSEFRCQDLRENGTKVSFYFFIFFFKFFIIWIDATVCVRDLDARVTDRLLFELFTQVGPVVNVFMPKDKLSGTHKGNAFIEFKSEDDAEYALRVMNMVKLYDRPIKVDKVYLLQY